MELHHDTDPGLVVLPAERDRLVRLCAHLTGRADAAEDLAQDTLVEAWRQRHKLLNPEGQAPWLSAIARNVCLRWRQRNGRERHHVSLVADAPEATTGIDETVCSDGADLEIELERHELAELLDRALALLPPSTRQALVHEYVEDLSRAEIAARLGISEGAVAVRLHRGKVALRRVLLREVDQTSASYLPAAASGTWETTRLWCSICGSRRLLGRITGNPAVVTLRCSEGCDGPSQCQMESLVPGQTGTIGYGRAVSRVRTMVDRDYGLNRGQQPTRCSTCGRPAPLRIGPPEGLPRELQTSGIHVFVHCLACDGFRHSSLEGVALSLPEAQRFARRHPRLRAWQPQELEVDGLPALLSRFVSLQDGARLDVLIRQDSFRLISIHDTPAR